MLAVCMWVCECLCMSVLGMCLCWCEINHYYYYYYYYIVTPGYFHTCLAVCSCTTHAIRRRDGPDTPVRSGTFKAITSTTVAPKRHYSDPTCHMERVSRYTITAGQHNRPLLSGSTVDKYEHLEQQACKMRQTGQECQQSLFVLLCLAVTTR